MSKEIKEESDKPEPVKKRPIIITFLGIIITILLILATLEISNRNVNAFISTQQKYILSIETAILAIFIVEMLVRVVTLRFHTPQTIAQGTRLRLIVRIVGYFITAVSVISILAANPTLGISVGAIAGVVIAFATQNIVGSVLAAIFILSTRMIHVGEEITVGGITGTVSDIQLTHIVISIEDEVLFVPNSLIISSIVRRKKRNSDKNADVRDW
jgi:small conductance mechanosensitive channel